MPDITSLIIPSFLAGLITFLAPCTLPLVPGFLGFISGSAHAHAQHDTKSVTRSLVWNAFLYVAGFSIVFIVFGVLFGIAGSALVPYRMWLTRLSGLFVVFFGLYLVHAFENKYFAFLYKEKRFALGNKLQPGKPTSSLLFGMTFALGWTPCVGPVLGTVLLLATTSQTAFSGALLLAVFSLGLGVPFLLVALFWGRAAQYIHAVQKKLHVISIIGGIFLIAFGLLILFDHIAWFTGTLYQLFDFLQYEERLLDFV